MIKRSLGRDGDRVELARLLSNGEGADEGRKRALFERPETLLGAGGICDSRARRSSKPYVTT